LTSGSIKDTQTHVLFDACCRSEQLTLDHFLRQASDQDFLPPNEFFFYVASHLVVSAEQILIRNTFPGDATPLSIAINFIAADDHFLSAFLPSFYRGSSAIGLRSPIESYEEVAARDFWTLLRSCANDKP